MSTLSIVFFIIFFLTICVYLTWSITMKVTKRITVPKEIYDQVLRELDKHKMTLEQHDILEKKAEKKLEEQQEFIKLSFENLAEKVLEKKEEKFSQTSLKGLSEILSPFKEKVSELQNKIEKAYSDESRERFALKNELNRIVEAGQKMTEETSNLTKALKGDVKMQGNWGEFILDKVLTVAGLREGQEYIKQGQSINLKDEMGSQQKPDVIIALPEGKHLIIDAKVSLISYEKLINATTSEGREIANKQFLTSLYQHIDDLASKKYHHNERLLSPDFTIMFIPIEGAFALSMNAESELFSYAWSKSIVIAGPVNLLTTLKTVGSLWRQDRQNKHVLTIAQEAGKLYDKMVSFTEDMQKIGEQIEKSKSFYDQALNKLTLGKGNVIGRMLSLKEMGVKNSKDFSGNITQEVLDNKSE